MYAWSRVLCGRVDHELIFLYMKRRLLIISTMLVLSVAIGVASGKYYCKFCGSTYSSVSSLTSGKCPRHPDGAYKGRHQPYEGEPKSKYFCKYCGSSYSSISSLTSGMCPRHPDGSYKGHHNPYKGEARSRYECRFCGSSATSISSLTSGRCPRHPDGSYKGRHQPMD